MAPGRPSSETGTGKTSTFVALSACLHQHLRRAILSFLTISVVAVREAIGGASLVYLPPYSPDLNPIEQAYAKLKALLQNRRPNHLRDILGRFTPRNAPTISPTLDTFRSNGIRSSVLIEKFIGSCMPDSEGMIHGKAGGGD